MTTTTSTKTKTTKTKTKATTDLDTLAAARGAAETREHVAAVLGIETSRVGKVAARVLDALFTELARDGEFEPTPAALYTALAALGLTTEALRGLVCAADPAGDARAVAAGIIGEQALEALRADA